VPSDNFFSARSGDMSLARRFNAGKDVANKLRRASDALAVRTENLPKQYGILLLPGVETPG
jgi:hypothetical protein